MGLHRHEQQKLEALGTLASGGAHEDKYPLNSMLDYAELHNDDIIEGTGLDLSINLGLVKDHNGILHFESEEGKYTSFILDLPIDNEI
ncbi:MAG: hypothetical protein JXQ26_09630 [Tissierellales bacterium]|nr:hypothetical protein [Tissierellales bacterium]MBN2828241.1 hypothetical protein [Tissierellales bacterium]